jgi:hypothetical protein
MSVQRVSVAIEKELRAIGPAGLVCLVAFAAAPLVNSDAAHDLVTAVYFVGAITLGALSMGHEYSGGTLSLLLSQPRRRAEIALLKLGVLVPVLLVLGALALLIGGASGNARAVVFLVPLLCGLFIAPWITMLCRNPLAAIVFTAATPALLLVVSRIVAAMRFGADPAARDASLAFALAALLWGILAISFVAALFGWRLFMRLEVIDGPSEAIALPWMSTGSMGTAAVPQFAKRHVLWLLAKKELRLQQLPFVVAGLYVLGWLGTLAAKSAMPHVYSTFLFALTALNVLAVPFLAGSVASAEERQLGTLEWHALLPMPARTQWAVKAGIALGVACVLGLAVPMVLTFLTGSRETHDAMRPFFSPGVGGVVIYLAVVSLYVSSLCATSLQALLSSVAAGLGLMMFLSRGLVAGIVRREANPWFNAFGFLTEWRFWLIEPRTGLLMLLVVLSTLAIVTYAGVFGFLLRFAQANHRSAERSARRASRQLLSLGAFLAILTTLSAVVSNRFQAQADAYSRDVAKRTWGFVTFAALDGQRRPITRYTVVIFREDPSRDGRPQGLRTIDSTYFARLPDAPRDTIFLPGRYSVVAIEPIARDSQALRDPDTIARLKARAVPFTIAAGESKTLQLTLSRY